MHPLRFFMIGGFLGAGKTTALARLARSFIERGQKVALVTNDQAYGLVDTETLRAQGFDVGEVPGACFCCKFDELVDTVASLARTSRPDVVLTEPVGSCTDLMATVVRPLAHLYGDQYQLAPLTVLCKPEHGLKILGGANAGFSPQAEYIFRKQLEEAQIIALNKVDKLSDEDRSKLLQLLAEQYGGRRILAVSAKTGAGFDELFDALDDQAVTADPPLEIDYDLYAAGEAEMGWLNATVRMVSAERGQASWSLDHAVQELVEAVSEALRLANAEPGHVKVLGSAALVDGGLATSVANWVASDAPVELSVGSAQRVDAADLLINARVSGDPAMIADAAERAATQVAQRHALICRMADVQQFRPARPEPTHRYSATTG